MYDTVNGFNSRDWRRVVCLFTNGEYFQLKDWPYEDLKSSQGEVDRQQKVVKLFHNVKGFYLHY